MYSVKRYPDLKTICRVIRCYSIPRKSHYDVLQVQRNCTDKEIKQAFIKMSKEYHPDKNKDVMAQEQFIRITEAYNTLSKPGSRAQYDMSEMDPTHSHPYVYRSPESYSYRQNTQHSYYNSSRSQRNTQSQSEQSYYGVKGLRRVPNLYVIILCFGVVFVGTLMQVFVIRELYVIHRQQAMQRSKRLAEELDRVRVAAQRHPNEVQTRLLLERIVGAANPTVATASMGQALATDKKAPPHNGSSFTEDAEQEKIDVRDSIVEPLLTEYGVQVAPSDDLSNIYYTTAPKHTEDLSLYNLVRSLIHNCYRGA